jgi:trehalose 6-phosphate phosphatase
MQHLFSPQGEAALAAVMKAQPLLAFDFDGTLAPIVSRPDEARVAHDIERRLDRLGQRLPLAIVSGRSVDDIRKRFSFEPRYVIGNHGAEDPLVPRLPPAALDGMRARVRLHALDLQALGVGIEDKGYSIALHYRQSNDRESALQLLGELVRDLPPGLDAYGGKLVMNIVGSSAPNKAAAVASLVRQSGAPCAVFLGDDVNDEPVFAAAAPEWLTVKVGRDDTPSLAKFYVESPDEVALVLQRMLALLGVAD